VIPVARVPKNERRLAAIGDHDIGISVVVQIATLAILSFCLVPRSSAQAIAEDCANLAKLVAANTTITSASPLAVHVGLTVSSATAWMRKP
jgi:hypothetical protein